MKRFFLRSFWPLLVLILIQCLILFVSDAETPAFAAGRLAAFLVLDLLSARVCYCKMRERQAIQRRRDELAAALMAGPNVFVPGQHPAGMGDFVAGSFPMPARGSVGGLASSARQLPAGPGCPFYGYSAVMTQKALVGTGGNQCALILDRFTPCGMERHGGRADWSRCPLNVPGAGAEIITFTRYEFANENRPPARPNGGV